MKPQTFTPEPPPVGAPETPRRIEADLDRERASLTASIEALRDRLSVDALMRDGMDFLKQNAASYTRVVDEAVRANPMAVALTGIGLAWLVLGRRSPATEPPCGALAGTRYEAITRWEDEGGPVAPPEDPLDDADDAWVAEADGLRARAAEALRRIDRAARDRLAPAADLARDRAVVLADLTRDVRQAMRGGLGQLSEAARDRVVAAREAAYALRIDPRQAGRRTVEGHPLLTGALVAAAGAALGALLPPTQTEHRVLGATRDRLLDEARRALQEERARAGLVAQSLADALKADLERASRHVAGAAETLAQPPSAPVRHPATGQRLS